jgi:hypothetical protein
MSNASPRANAKARAASKTASTTPVDDAGQRGRVTAEQQEQTPTTGCSIKEIMGHPHFARGLDDIRSGQPFGDHIDDAFWSYERGRQFGALAPLQMPLFIGRKLNPKAVMLFRAAMYRGLIL